ncbi:ABC-F family ATP-binding cassette domain-containing protein [Arthrobacter sp. HMSC08H08]|uniref:ABC-F family ATP-binding cassette domain-containing protein n=1 Tax=Arthrobacter sp. HMSC08H08 TaxID=1581143 RepID=UPI0008A1F521|nr:ABC-F family ATP-binding cassette domain-containing protein [Arthrobacter sp. HMSC08H08]OFT22235.1 ABC transporter ATP-binding protein [Arthrobacter sp. HMSC08H08]
MPSINLQSISFAYASHQVLDDVSLHVSDGERAFLVGPNGCGKSTLLNLVLGRLKPDSGHIASGVVEPPIHEAEGFNGTVAEYFAAALAPLHELSHRFEETTASLATGDSGTEREYDQLLAAMTAHDVWSLEARLDETLEGLGLGVLSGSSERLLTSLSPGQCARLHLAALLTLQPDVLILDEPTNHLDREAIDFLTAMVTKWPGPVLVSSHDRLFIENVATVIYDMDITVWQELARAEGHELTGGLFRNAGNYSQYLDAKEKARQSHRQIHAEQQAHKHQIREHRNESMTIARGGVRLKTATGKAKKFFADRAAATSVKRTRNDDVKLERLEEREVRKPRDYQLELSIPTPEPYEGLALSIRHAAVEHRLAPCDLDLAAGEHLLVTGDNGAGKSTLLQWIATAQPPQGVISSGIITREEPVTMVPQRLPMENDPGFTVGIWHNGVGQLGKGVIHPAMWSTPIPELSDGNQRRAQIAVAISAHPSTLIVDEPTNYLDLDTIESLERALRDWPGTLIIASHDRWLIEHWQGRHLHLQSCR